MPFGSQNSTDGLGIQAPAHEEILRTGSAWTVRPFGTACVESQVQESVGRRSAAGTIAGQVRAASRAAIPLMGREMTRPRGPKNAGRSGARPLDGKGATTVCLSRRGILLHLSHKF